MSSPTVLGIQRPAKEGSGRKGEGKSDVPRLGRPSEDSGLNKYLLNESVHVCQELGTKIKVP